MDSPVGSLDGGPLPDHFHKAGVGGHAKLERQGSKGSKGSSTPSRRVQSSAGTRVDPDKHSDDLHGPLSIVGVGKIVDIRMSGANPCRNKLFLSKVAGFFILFRNTLVAELTNTLDPFLNRIVIVLIWR